MVGQVGMRCHSCVHTRISQAWGIRACTKEHIWPYLSAQRWGETTSVPRASSLVQISTHSHNEVIQYTRGKPINQQPEPKSREATFSWFPRLKALVHGKLNAGPASAIFSVCGEKFYSLRDIFGAKLTHSTWCCALLSPSRNRTPVYFKDTARRISEHQRILNVTDTTPGRQHEDRNC